jgi:quinol monooxygenase YgiN
MIVIRVALNVKPEARDRFVAHIQQQAREAREFGGCERFELFGDLVDGNRFFIYEEWKDRSSFSGYRDSEYFLRNREQLFSWVAGPPDNVYYSADAFGP